MSCGVVACVDDCWCDVMGGVCMLVGILVVVHKGWLGGSGSGGCVLGVGIWFGACLGSGGVLYGVGSVVVVFGEVVCGYGGGVVVFCLHVRLPSVFPTKFGQAFFPA